MARYLIVSSTSFEVQPLLELCGIAVPSERIVTPHWFKGTGEFDLLVTGVGQMQAAFHVGRALAAWSYSVVLNFGIAGSFRDALPKCAVVRITSEELADLGAEDGEAALDLFEMGLLERDVAPFAAGALPAPELALDALNAIPTARSVTVNKVLGSARSMAQVVARYDPDVVNMEGAAIFYACLTMEVPFLSIRSISDRVGPRDKAAWDIPGSIAALTVHALAIVDELRLASSSHQR